MPVVIIKLAGTLAREQKRKVTEEITATLERHAGKPASCTYIACMITCRTRTGRSPASCSTRTNKSP